MEPSAALLLAPQHEPQRLYQAECVRCHQVLTTEHPECVARFISRHVGVVLSTHDW